jgi:hypothetical protein
MRPITIEFWEYLIVVFYMVLIGAIFSRTKNINIKKHPEYKYYIWGVYAKIVGGVMFSMIYVYYYGNGDTISYFTSAQPLAKLLMNDPVTYVKAMVEENSWSNYYRFFNQETGYPHGYVYIDSRTFILSKLISPLVILGMNSFLLTGALVSTIAFGGIWSLYKTFVRYYPSLRGELAIAILFFPSTVFWGSGIMKDTFTFTAMCWYVHSMDSIFFQKRDKVKSWFTAVIATLVMISMKPYIFMMIFPGTLLWIMYHRVQRLPNAMIRALFLPFALITMGFITVTILNSLGDQLNKFSLDKALETVVVAQKDMKRSEQYGDNYFDLGEVEATWTSVISKFPSATFAGLFLPSILHSNNIVMFIAALENTWLLIFFVRILVRTRIYHFITLLRTNPLLQMCFLFTMGYAFMIGVTTPNFGAMVRFKIPLLPLFVSAMYISSFILDKRRDRIRNGKHFSFTWFTDGEPRGLQPETASNVRKQSARPTSGIRSRPRIPLQPS